MMPDRAPDWLTAQSYAHRGLHSLSAPENSRSAVERAIAAGFGVECDIQMSRDNVPMVFHDWDLERLTSARGRLNLQTSENLKRLRLSESDDTVWTLADFLECVGERAAVLVEIKSLPHFDIASACTAIAACLRGYNGPVAVMSFDPRAGEWFAKHAPEFLRGLVTTDTYDHGFLSAWRQPQSLDRAQPDFLASDIRDLPNALANLWQESGRPLLTWTVRTPELRAHGEACADALIAEDEGIL